MMSLPHPFDDQQGHVQQHDQVHNSHAPAHYPQLEHRPLTSNTFLDFVTPNRHATIPITGAWQSLESLNHTLSSPGVFARRSPSQHAFSAYTPLAIALNAICAKVGQDPITEHDLAQLHRAPWFADFAKAAVKRHNFEGMNNINLDNLVSDSCLSEDHMVLLAEAFSASQDLSTIELGIVAITKGGVKAFHYPWTAACDGLTAWVVADCRTNNPVYYGLGHDIVEQQKSSKSKRIGEEDHESEEEEDADDEGQEAPATTPRKTAARVLAQQIPLPAGLSAKDILERHIDNLQYNNILKVGLHYSNQEIAKKVAEDAEGKNKKFSTGASGVVKRINTGIDFIEKEFDIDVGAFRTAYDTARKDNGIPIRGKDGVDDRILAANASKINAAMTWVKAGGPRPAAAVAPAPSVSTNNQGPVGARHSNNIPQFDGATDEPDYDYDEPPQTQSDSFLTQLNNDAMDWDSMFNSDGIFNFDNFN